MDKDRDRNIEKDSESRSKPHVVAVVGPTGSGKSALAVALAKHIDGEILSCDSMQIYRGMDVGTGKITEDEKETIPHHLLDIADPHEVYSCADYVRDAARCVEDVASRGKIPIFCGGTGLYLDSLLCARNFEQPEACPEYRAELEALAQSQGNGAVYQLLCRVDPESAAKIHENNLRRVIRALEIYRCRGITKSELDRQSQLQEKRYHSLVIGLRYLDRQALYDRIDCRVDRMMEQGLENEVRSLWKSGVFVSNHTAAQAIGYKEILEFLQGTCTRDEAVQAIKQASKHYAKRQMTWFSSHGEVQWIDIDGNPNFEKIINIAVNLFQSFVNYDIIN